MVPENTTMNGSYSTVNVDLAIPTQTESLVDNGYCLFLEHFWPLIRVLNQDRSVGKDYSHGVQLRMARAQEMVHPGSYNLVDGGWSEVTNENMVATHFLDLSFNTFWI